MRCESALQVDQCNITLKLHLIDTASDALFGQWWRISLRRDVCFRSLPTARNHEAVVSQWIWIPRSISAPCPNPPGHRCWSGFGPPVDLVRPDTLGRGGTKYARTPACRLSPKCFWGYRSARTSLCKFSSSSWLSISVAHLTSESKLSSSGELSPEPRSFSSMLSSS